MCIGGQIHEIYFKLLLTPCFLELQGTGAGLALLITLSVGVLGKVSAQG